MDKERKGHLFLIMMILLMIVGLVVLFWGAATYVKPRVPFGGPQYMLWNILTGGFRG